MATEGLEQLQPDVAVDGDAEVHQVHEHQESEGSAESSALVAYQGICEVINARWELGSGRTVDLKLVGTEDAGHPFKRFTRRRKGIAGTIFRASMVRVDTTESVYEGDVMLAGWSESPSGQTVRLWLDEEADRHPMATLQKRHGKKSGEQLAVVLVELTDDELPVDQIKQEAIERAGKQKAFSQQAHLMVTSKTFIQYLRETKPRLVSEWTEESAKQYVKSVLGISSLADLDTSKSLVQKFHEQIRLPYAKWGGVA